MIICGRDLNAALLQRLQEQAASLSLRALGRWLCDALGLVGPSGKPQVSVAVQMLRALVKRGILSLIGRPVPSCSRGPRPARSEPAALKPASFAGSLAELGPVELVRVPSRWSRDYRRWRGLLQTYHYLGAGPLCGHQLRYLIKSAHGYLGAAAFSAAARCVAGRDQWIGWGDLARRENLHLIVNQSRFLIVPSVNVPHLASHVLAQMTAQLAADWQAAYGYRPVLAESFVELGRYQGTCYQAANWQAIGLTAGRGRQDGAHEAALPRKVLLVYPLQKDFRQVLCREPERPRLAPRPAPEPPPAPATWQEEEFGGVALGDERLVRRLHAIAGDFFARPTMNIPQACGSRARAKAVYRFLDHPRVHLESVLSGHYQATRRRAAAYPVVLAVQDTTELNYRTHRACEMLGPVGDRQSQAVGLLVHDTMAYNLEGTPLGLLDVQCWARDPEDRGKRERRYKLPIEQKESAKWLVSYRAATRLQAECPGTTVVSVGDREADVYELFVEARAREGQAQVLVRATRERKLEAEEEEEAKESRQLWAYVRGQPVAGEVELKVPRRGSCAARTAVLEMRYASVELKAPKRKPGLGSVRLWAIAAEEVGGPAEVEPIQWYLLTTLRVESLEQAVEKLRWYALRFQIEVYHRTLKSGCKIEERQLGHADRIEACLAIDMVVAWRIAHLTKLGREVPEVPCTVYFEEAQWQALVVFVTEGPPPTQPPTLREAVRMVATRLGGFLGRKSDGEPGAQCLWRGLQRLDDITQMWCAVQGQRWARPTEAELGEDSS